MSLLDSGVDAAAPAADLTDVLEPLRKQHRLVALGGAVVTAAGVKALGVTGERKLKSGVAVAATDRFHIGSCTKAMTATLLATYVEEGRLAWTDTLEARLPKLATSMLAAYRKVTVEQLLAHRAGLSGETTVPGMSLMDMHRLKTPIRDQRRHYVGEVLKRTPAAKPGTEEIYSNAGYVTAGLIAEELGDRPWEELITQRLFKPLGMKSAGFGAMGTPGQTDEPWQHQPALFGLRPIEPGPLSDNPPVIGPAGRVHCSLADWAAYVALHLRAAGPDRPPLKNATIQRTHTPIGEYGFGWGVVERDWAGGRVLTHAGSNTMSYAVAWVAPVKGFAVLAVTNQGRAERPIDATVERLLEWHQKGK